MARKKIDLKKGQNLIVIGNNTNADVIINRINKHDEVYDGYELTVVLEKPTVAPVSEVTTNNVWLSQYSTTPEATSNLILRTTGNNSATGLATVLNISGPNYYSGIDVSNFQYLTN